MITIDKASHGGYNVTFNGFDVVSGGRFGFKEATRFGACRRPLCQTGKHLSITRIFLETQLFLDLMCRQMDGSSLVLNQLVQKF